jgi:hypothetical protein
MTTTNPAEAHVVSPDDERRHDAGPEDLWGESYDADFVQEDGTVAGWLRLGRYPNRDVAWWTAWIVGPNRAGVCSVNYQLPVPGGSGLVVEDGASHVELELLRPLERFRIFATAAAQILDRPEDVYAPDVAGTSAQLVVDLTWTTDGMPFHYDLTSRYEIPCIVRGTVAIDGTVLAIAGQGQRDHSWGVRDWWAFGWCWASGRLDDGTRVHLADIRIPGFPIAFGYIQGGGAEGVYPVTELSVVEEPGEDGFPRLARIGIRTGPSNGGGGGAEGAPTDPNAAKELALTVTPIAFGSVLFRNNDGRVSRFPRALARFVGDEGRDGMGWIEWNQPDIAAEP